MNFFSILFVFLSFMLLLSIGNASILYADEHHISISEDGVLINENCQRPPVGYFTDKIPVKETNTCVTMKITSGLNLDYVNVMPILKTGHGITIPFADVIEIRIDGKY